MWSALLLGWVIGMALIGRPAFTLSVSFYPILILVLSWCIAIQMIFIHLQQALLRMGLAIISLLLGALLGLSYGNAALKQHLELKVHDRQEVSVIVYVERLNRLTVNSIQQPIKVLNYASQVSTWNVIQNVDSNKNAEYLQLGQYYQVYGEVRPVHGYANPGGFDLEKWALQQGLDAQFKIQHIQRLSEQDVRHFGLAHHVRRHHGIFNTFRLKVERARLNLREFIQQQPIRHKGLVLALVSGDESLLQPHTEQLFQRFGLSHLLAISGPHVLIFAILFCGLLSKLIQKYRPHYFLKCPRQLGLLLPFNTCVLLYCAFVGFEIPAIRTLLVSLVFSVCLLLKLKLSSLQLLLLSASLLLWIDPLSILSAAFWLSYGACFILLWIYQTLQQQPKIHESWRQKIKMGLGLLVESQWKIFIALLPLVLIFFQQVSWIAPVANLIAIPWIGLVIVPIDVLAACSFFIFPSLASLLFQINDLVIAALLAVFHLIDQIFQPKLHRMAFDIWEICALILALIILFLPRGIVPKTWALLCALPFLFLNPDRFPFEFNILDVGQGQSIFVRHAGKQIFLDVGGYYDETKFSVGERIILPFLAHKGVTQIDELWLSHLDQDHSGALPQIKNIKINRIIANEQPETLHGAHFEYCQQGQGWHWHPDIQVEVLWPPKGMLNQAAFDKNETSCVVLMTLKTTAQSYRFLMMGDVGWETEYQLMQQYPNLAVDVLVLGHHGSKHSSAYDFLKHVQPKIAIVSAGLNNRYGHPSTATLARLKSLDIPLHKTSETGNIQFVLDDQDKLKLIPYRSSRMWLMRD